jgi:replicative DNA helicase
MSPKDGMSKPSLVSVEAEQSLLGGVMLTGGEALHLMAHYLRMHHFGRADHRLIFEAIVSLSSRNAPSDAVMVGELLSQRGHLEAVGGLAYLARLVQDTPSAANIEAYAKIIIDRWRRRETYDVLTRLTGELAGEEDILAMVDRSTQRLTELVFDQSTSALMKAEHVLPEVMDKLDKLAHAEAGFVGLSTGYPDLDKKLGGMQGGQFIVVAGRPSMGKSALVSNIAQYVAHNLKRPVPYFSLEMSRADIVMRMMSSWSATNLKMKLENDDWTSITAAADKVRSASLWIDETPAQSLQQIRAKSRKLRHQLGSLGLIVVDYLQLMSSSLENRNQQISEISRGLKQLAREMNCPVICVSQLNRQVEARKDRHPMLSDLKESGDIEQDADVVLFVYRDVVYNENTLNKNVAEIVVGKQREGPTGTVLLWFEAEYTRFRQMDFQSQQSFWGNKLPEQKAGLGKI